MKKELNTMQLNFSIPHHRQYYELQLQEDRKHKEISTMVFIFFNAILATCLYLPNIIIISREERFWWIIYSTIVCNGGAFIACCLSYVIPYTYTSILIALMCLLRLPMDLLIFYFEPYGTIPTMLIMVLTLLPYMNILADSLFPSKYSNHLEITNLMQTIHNFHYRFYKNTWSFFSSERNQRYQWILPQLWGYYQTYSGIALCMKLLRQQSQYGALGYLLLALQCLPQFLLNFLLLLHWHHKVHLYATTFIITFVDILLAFWYVQGINDPFIRWEIILRLYIYVLGMLMISYDKYYKTFQSYSYHHHHHQQQQQQHEHQNHFMNQKKNISIVHSFESNPNDLEKGCYKNHGNHRNHEEESEEEEEISSNHIQNIILFLHSHITAMILLFLRLWKEINSIIKVIFIRDQYIHEDYDSSNDYENALIPNKNSLQSIIKRVQYRRQRRRTSKVQDDSKHQHRRNNLKVSQLLVEATADVDGTEKKQISSNNDSEGIRICEEVEDLEL